MRTLQRVLTVLLLVAVTSALMAGCQGTTSPPVMSTTRTRLRVSGSGTALPLLRILNAEQPDKSIELVFLPGLHSGGGIKGVIQGSLDIGAVSRPLTAAEQKAGLKLTWLSNDGLLIAVNPSVGQLGIKGLTTQQVRDIYSGKTTDWSQLGGSKKLPIIVLDRHEDESAKIILRKYVLGGALKITPKALPLYYESDMVDALQTTPGSVGYFSLGYALSQDIRVDKLSLDEVEPTVASIESGTYKPVRPLGVVTKVDAPREVAGFVDWALGDAARKLMADRGYAPYPK